MNLSDDVYSTQTANLGVLDRCARRNGIKIDVFKVQVKKRQKMHLVECNADMPRFFTPRKTGREAERDG
jgi:hypothetical protein